MTFKYLNVLSKGKEVIKMNDPMSHDSVAGAQAAYDRSEVIVSFKRDNVYDVQPAKMGELEQFLQYIGRRHDNNIIKNYKNENLMKNIKDLIVYNAKEYGFGFVDKEWADQYVEALRKEAKDVETADRIIKEIFKVDDLLGGSTLSW